MSPKVIGFGALSTSQQTLAKVPSGKLWIVRAAIFHAGATGRAVSVFIRRSDSSRRIAYTSIGANGSFVAEEGWILEQNDSIEAMQDVGTDVSYYIYGTEMAAS